MALCECGCGQEVKPGRRFINGHATKGKKLSDSHKKKIGEGNRGKNLGRNMSDGTKRKIRKSCIGINLGKKYALGSKRTDKQKRAISKIKKGNQHALGRKHTEEAKDKMSKAKSRENNPSWQGGISIGIYCSRFNHHLRESIRDKFGRVCFICGKTEEANGRKLDVHHVDYNREQGCNGHEWILVPLCMMCHSKISKNNKKYYEALILEKLEERVE